MTLCKYVLSGFRNLNRHNTIEFLKDHIWDQYLWSSISTTPKCWNVNFEVIRIVLLLALSFELIPVLLLFQVLPRNTVPCWICRRVGAVAQVRSVMVTILVARRMVRTSLRLQGHQGRPPKTKKTTIYRIRKKKTRRIKVTCKIHFYPFTFTRLVQEILFQLKESCYYWRKVVTPQSQMP